MLFRSDREKEYNFLKDQNIYKLEFKSTCILKYESSKNAQVN